MKEAMPRAIRIAQASSAVQPCAIPQNFVIASGAKQSIVVMEKDGLLRRGACHRARIRATRWLLAMTANTTRFQARRKRIQAMRDQGFVFLTAFLAGWASAAFRIDRA